MSDLTRRRDNMAIFHFHNRWLARKPDGIAIGMTLGDGRGDGVGRNAFYSSGADAGHDVVIGNTALNGLIDVRCLRAN
jgi:hypothetical protein